MIEHVDAALEAWLGTLQPPVEVTFDAGPDAPTRSNAKKVTLTLLIRTIRERTEARDTAVRDVRDADGRVLERQRSTRYFEVDYLCTPRGESIAAHRVLGALLQLLVDHDQVPAQFVPGSVGAPLEVHLVTRAGAGQAGATPVGIVLQVVMPVRPSATTAIAPPAEQLDLEMVPPPEPRQAAIATPRTGSGPAFDPADRRWTRVRRREMIVRPGDDA